jgi:hypothetical protein
VTLAIRRAREDTQGGVGTLALWPRIVLCAVDAADLGIRSKGCRSERKSGCRIDSGAECTAIHRTVAGVFCPRRERRWHALCPAQRIPERVYYQLNVIHMRTRRLGLLALAPRTHRAQARALKENQETMARFGYQSAERLWSAPRVVALFELEDRSRRSLHARVVPDRVETPTLFSFFCDRAMPTGDRSLEADGGLPTVRHW